MADAVTASCQLGNTGGGVPQVRQRPVCRPSSSRPLRVLLLRRLCRYFVSSVLAITRTWLSVNGGLAPSPSPSTTL